MKIENKGLTSPAPYDIIRMYQRGTQKKIKEKEKVISMTNTEKTKKMTKKDRFNQLLELEAVKANAELVVFIEHEIELLENKNKSKTGEKKPTATQIENEKLKDAIVEFMKPNNLYTISEMIKKIPECAELSNQKMSALLRQLVEENLVAKVEEKRKIYWTLK